MRLQLETKLQKLEEQVQALTNNSGKIFLYMIRDSFFPGVDGVGQIFM
jgi:hypothetical protein